MTDYDGRSNDLKICQTRIFTPNSSLGQNPASSSSTSVNLNEVNPPTIANTDSEGDYETSSEGPHSPKPEFHQSKTTSADSFDGNIIPGSNESLLVSTAFFSEEDTRKRNDLSASYTIIGIAESPRTSKISNCVDQIESSSSSSRIETHLNDLDEFEARRTEYFVASRIKTDANKSESLPVITIATPWGSYEYPDDHMPAERLVSDSQVDIKEKMRLIATCMDGSDSLKSETEFLDESKQLFYPDVLIKDETKSEDNRFSDAECNPENIGVYSRPVTPRTPKLITVTSPKIFSEPFNVLPIIRNPDLGSDYTFTPSLSGSSLPLTINNKARVDLMSSSFYQSDIADSPRNLNPKKSNFDPLSRIEGELAPLQNELSEIRGKVRALNLDYNLSCIDGMTKFPKAMNWIIEENSSSHAQIRPVKDDFVMTDFHIPQNQNTTFNSNFEISNFMGNNQPNYRYQFSNQSPDPFAHSYDFEGIENNFKTSEIICKKMVIHPEVSPEQILSSENCEQEVEEMSLGSSKGTDRNLSPVYVCTSKPSIINSKLEVELAESEDGTESSEEKERTSEEIRLPDFLDKISIVPIAYLGGMPDPPAEPVFNFVEEQNYFQIDHKVLKIEHPDAPRRLHNESAETSSSFSDTAVLTFDNDTEDSLSARKESEDNNSCIENSLGQSDRISGYKFSKNISCDHISNSTQGNEIHKKIYIRGLISGPEDFL